MFGEYAVSVWWGYDNIIEKQLNKNKKRLRVKL